MFFRARCGTPAVLTQQHVAWERAPENRNQAHPPVHKAMPMAMPGMPMGCPAVPATCAQAAGAAASAASGAKEPPSLASESPPPPGQAQRRKRKSGAEARVPRATAQLSGRSGGGSGQVFAGDRRTEGLFGPETTLVCVEAEVVVPSTFLGLDE